MYVYLYNHTLNREGFTKVDLTHWGRVTHICVSKLTIIGSDNGLLPDRRQAIIWTNAGLSLIGPLWTNFSEILIEILTFSFKKMHLKVSSAKRRPFCLGLNVLTQWSLLTHICQKAYYSCNCVIITSGNGLSVSKLFGVKPLPEPKLTHQ